MSSIILQSPSKKELTRAYLLERRESPEPPPNRERVRELMGWPMHEAERDKKPDGFAR